MKMIEATGRSQEPPFTAPCPDIFKLPLEIYEMMLANLKVLLPEEGCGFLASQNGAIVALLPVENALHSPTRFQMASTPMVAALHQIIEKEWQLSAVYHSHPAGPAQLSATDLAELNYREACQIVVSFQDPNRPETAVFRVTDEGILRIPLQIL